MRLIMALAFSTICFSASSRFWLMSSASACRRRSTSPGGPAVISLSRAANSASRRFCASSEARDSAITRSVLTKPTFCVAAVCCADAAPAAATIEAAAIIETNLDCFLGFLCWSDAASRLLYQRRRARGYDVVAQGRSHEIAIPPRTVFSRRPRLHRARRGLSGAEGRRLGGARLPLPHRRSAGRSAPALHHHRRTHGRTCAAAARHRGLRRDAAQS